jgi:hypothetical protein
MVAESDGQIITPSTINKKQMRKSYQTQCSRPQSKLVREYFVRVIKELIILEVS